MKNIYKIPMIHARDLLVEFFAEFLAECIRRIWIQSGSSLMLLCVWEKEYVRICGWEESRVVWTYKEMVFTLLCWCRTIPRNCVVAGGCMENHQTKRKRGFVQLTHLSFPKENINGIRNFQQTSAIINDTRCMGLVCVSVYSRLCFCSEKAIGRHIG